MPQFFFHIRSRDGSLSRDDLGLDLPDVETACVEAFRAARGLEGVFTARSEDPSDYAVEVVDASGGVVLCLPFSKIFREQPEAEAASPSQGRQDA